MRHTQAIIEFGENLKKLRKQKGYSHQRLADEADIAKSTVIKIEKAKINISLDIIISLAEALGVNPKDLLDFPM